MKYPTYLIHYGTQGQRWGHRRWQNEDGSLTPEGREHYGVGKSNKPSSGELVRSGAKSTASGAGYAIRTANRAVRGVAKTAFKGNVVFAKNAIKGIKTGVKTVADGGDAKEGLNAAKTGIKTGAKEAYDAKKAVAKESANSTKQAAKTSAEKLGEGAIKTAAGITKVIKDKNSNDPTKHGFTIDKKYGVAEKKKDGISFSLNKDYDTKDYNKALSAYKKMEPRIPEIKKSLDKDLNRILKTEFNDWGIPSKHNIKLQNVRVIDDNLAEASYWDDGPNDPLYGHILDIEFDPKTGKYYRHSLNG